MTDSNKPKNLELEPSGESGAEALDANPEVAIDGDMDFGEALNYLEGYAEDNPTLADQLVDARNGNPDALNSLLLFISDERDRAEGAEYSAQIDKTLGELNLARIAIEVHRERVKTNSAAAAERARIYAEAEQRQTEEAEKARGDAHEAINNQVPNKADFNHDTAELAKRFGMGPDSLLNGDPYDGMRDNHPKELVALHNLITATLKNPNLGQDEFVKFGQARDRLLGGISNGSPNNISSIAPNSGSDQFQ